MAVLRVDSIALTRPLPENATARMRAERNVRGALPLSSLLRLHDVLAHDAGEMHWRAEFSCVAKGTRQLNLQLHGELQLLCQRCLGALAYPFELARTFQLVDTEAEADRLFEADPEAEIEPIVAGNKFDLAALIEDEIILALPAIRTHAQCALRQEDMKGAEQPLPECPKRPTPFAGLAALKKSK